MKKVKTIKFLDSLGAYYSYITAWKVVKEVDLKLVDVYVDNFEGERTSAWDELGKHNKITVFPKGDQCNLFISTADIVLNYIENKIKSGGIRLDKNEICNLLREINIKKYSVFHSGGPDIVDLVPKSDEKIPYNSNYIRPLVYVINEGLMARETHWIENSPVYQHLLKFTSNIEGGLKYITFDKDYKNIRNNDYLVYLGEEGRRKAEYIVKVLGYPLKITGLSDILEDKIL